MGLATNIRKWILNRARKFSGFQNIFITKPEKNHITLFPPLSPLCSLQRDHRRFILRSDEWFRRSEVDYKESLLIWILYLNSRLTQFVMVSFFLKEKKVGCLVYKSAKQNSLQTVNNILKRQNPKLHTTKGSFVQGRVAVGHFKISNREPITQHNLIWPRPPFLVSPWLLYYTEILSLPFHVLKMNFIECCFN